MQKATLPDFVKNAERAVVGPFALWAPQNVGPVRRWCGVDTSDPTVRLSVLTCANPSEPGVRFQWSSRRTVREDFAWLGGGALPLPATAGVDDRWRVDVGTGAPAWIARRAHPGITLGTLIAADGRGDPPRELLAGVVRALMSGAHSCEEIVSPHDIVVGVDGVVTVDGFDLRRPGWWHPAGSPLHANNDECRRVVAAALHDLELERDEIDELLAHVAATGDFESECERELIAGVVAGLMPAACRAEYDAAEQLSLLGPAAWAAWGTSEGQERADGWPPPVSARDRSPRSTSRYNIVSDVDVRFVGKMSGARSRFVCRERVLELVVGNADDFVASNHPRDWCDVAVVVGSGAIPAGLATIRASSLAEARRASVIVCDFVESALHHEGTLRYDEDEPLAMFSSCDLTTHRIFVTSLAEKFDDFVAHLRVRPGLLRVCICIVGTQWTTLQEIQGVVTYFEDLLGDDDEINFTYRVRSSRLCVEVIAVYAQL